MRAASLNISLIQFARAKRIIRHRWGYTAYHRIISPCRSPSFEERGRSLIGSELRHLRLVATLAARCRVLFGASSRRLAFKGLGSKARPPRRSSHLTTEEVEDVVRALTTVVENLEASCARQSMQEAFMQVRAHAGELRALARDRSPPATTV